MGSVDLFFLANLTPKDENCVWVDSNYVPLPHSTSCPKHVHLLVKAGVYQNISPTYKMRDFPCHIG